MRETPGEISRKRASAWSSEEDCLENFTLPLFLELAAAVLPLTLMLEKTSTNRQTLKTSKQAPHLYYEDILKRKRDSLDDSDDIISHCCGCVCELVVLVV